MQKRDKLQLNGQVTNISWTTGSDVKEQCLRSCFHGRKADKSYTIEFTYTELFISMFCSIICKYLVFLMVSQVTFVLVLLTFLDKWK